MYMAVDKWFFDENVMREDRKFAILFGGFLIDLKSLLFFFYIFYVLYTAKCIVSLK